MNYIRCYNQQDKISEIVKQMQKKVKKLWDISKMKWINIYSNENIKEKMENVEEEVLGILMMLIKYDEMSLLI